MGQKYRVVCYMRIDCEDEEPMTLEEALGEVDQAKMMQPENHYEIEEIEMNLPVRFQSETF